MIPIISLNKLYSRIYPTAWTQINNQIRSSRFCSGSRSSSIWTNSDCSRCRTRARASFKLPRTLGLRARSSTLAALIRLNSRQTNFSNHFSTYSKCSRFTASLSLSNCTCSSRALKSKWRRRRSSSIRSSWLRSARSSSKSTRRGRTPLARHSMVSWISSSSCSKGSTLNSC